MSTEPSGDGTRRGTEPDRARGKQEPLITRRSFLSGVAALGVAASAAGLPGLSEIRDAEAADLGPSTGTQRADQALNVRVNAARFEREQPLPDHPDNGDEALYPNKIASYSKALPHNDLGEVDPAAYDSLIHALTTGRPEDFEAILLGGVAKLANPQAALAFDLLGPDSHQLAIPPAPTFDSAQQAAEMAELYWQALSRDVPFSQYGSAQLAQEATRDLSQFSDFRAPKDGGRVTARTLFRGDLPGDLVGPYISQFLWADIPFGARPLEQQYRTTAPNTDFLTAYDRWLANQNGAAVADRDVFDPVRRYIRNGRDLGEWVHRDFPYMGFLDAALILLTMGPPSGQDGEVLPGSLVLPTMGAPFDQSNPYVRSRTQTGFTTFGIPDVLDAIAVVANRALKATWYQKWLVHRRLRPEEFAGRIHNQRTGRASYPIHGDLLKSPVLGSVFDKYGTYLLPQAYPEGSPTHSAYPAGHAAFAGACCTILKAFLDESFVIPRPVVASDDGLSLKPFDGESLTVGGELNKLASNLSIGRSFAGVHFRSCSLEGLKLGEAVALGVLAEIASTYHEPFPGFTLTKFDGDTIVVGPARPQSMGK